MKCQQTELYASEAKHGLRGRSFDSLEEIYEYVNALRDTWWWQRYYSDCLEVQVIGHLKGNSGSVGGWYPEDQIALLSMHEAHWCEQYVLHELAHPLAALRYGSQAHCPWFARVYMELVSLVMGPRPTQHFTTGSTRTGSSTTSHRRRITELESLSRTVDKQRPTW